VRTDGLVAADSLVTADGLVAAGNLVAAAPAHGLLTAPLPPDLDVPAPAPDAPGLDEPSAGEDEPAGADTANLGVSGTIAAELAGWAAGELPGEASARLAAWATVGGVPAPAYRDSRTGTAY
jgi:hypothetical protein